MDVPWTVHLKWMNCIICNLSLNTARAEKYTHSGEGIATHKFTQAKKTPQKQKTINNTYSLGGQSRIKISNSDNPSLKR